jgi:cell division protein FtsL
MAVVPATRRSVAAPQPQRTPATRERRPQLRVVEQPERRRSSLGVITVLVVGAVFALLFGLVVFHTMLLQNQQRLDHVSKQVSEQQARYQSLRLQVAQLESPQRIIDEATHKLGMVPPDGTTYLTPAADEAAVDSAGANQGDPSDTADTAAPASDGASAWPEVKPYLGAAP